MAGEFGSWMPGLDTGERLARTRCLRALVGPCAWMERCTVIKGK
jgi:hypothetical protein